MNPTKTPAVVKPTGQIDIAPAPLAVKLLKFVVPQDGPGFSVASSLNTVVNGRASKHTIEFMPWVRAFRVTYTSDDGTIIGYIPEHRVACWYPAG